MTLPVATSRRLARTSSAANDGVVLVLPANRVGMHVAALDHGTGRTSVTTRTPTPSRTDSPLAQVKTLISYPGFRTIAETVESIEETRRQYSERGRPRMYPDWLMVLIHAAVWATGSQTKAIALISDADMWNVIRRHAKRELTGVTRLPATAPARHHLTWFNHRVRTDARLARVLSRLVALAQDAALADAHAAGLLKNREFQYKHPDAGQYLAYDGTVFAPQSRRWPGRDTPDPTASAQMKAGQRVHGCKVLFGSIRADQPWSRIIISATLVTGTTQTGVGDEAAAIVTDALAVKANTPGLHGVIADGILAGTHITTLATHGLVCVTPVKAKANPNRAEGGRYATGRVEKTARISTFTHDRHGTPCTHPIVLHGSTLGETAIGDDGNETFVPFPCARYYRRVNADRTIRHYKTVTITCRDTEHEHTIPMYHGNTDTNLAYAQGELQRVFPVGTPEYDYLYGRRNDTESLHNQIKHTITRMPAYGAELQRVLLLGFQLIHNAHTWHQQQRTTKAPPRP